MHVSLSYIKNTSDTAEMLKLEMPPFEEILHETRGNEELLKELVEKFQLWLKQQLHLPQGLHFQI